MVRNKTDIIFIAHHQETVNYQQVKKTCHLFHFYFIFVQVNKLPQLSVLKIADSIPVRLGQKFS